MAPTSYLSGAGLLVLWGQVDITKVHEEELNDWWTNEHLPERLHIPGFLRARRYIAACSSSSFPSSNGIPITHRNYLTVYEVSTLDVLTSSGYTVSLDGPTAKTAKYMATMENKNRSACTVLYSAPRPEFAGLTHGVGGSLAHIVVTPPPASSSSSSPTAQNELKSWIADTLAPSFFSTSHPTVLALHVVERDEGATQSGTQTQSYVGVSFSTSEKAETRSEQWIVLVEMSTAPSAVPGAGKRAERVQPLVEQLRGKGAEMVSLQIYDLIITASE